jgi:polyferredoxin
MDCPGLCACVSAADNTVFKMSMIIWYLTATHMSLYIRDRHRLLFDQGGNGDPQLVGGFSHNVGRRMDG